MAVILSEAAQRYADPVFQGRAQAACAEQAGVFVNDGRPEYVGLAQGVIAGNTSDIDAIIRQVCVTDTGGDMSSDDDALRGAVQAVWPVVAAARGYKPELGFEAEAPAPTQTMV